VANQELTLALKDLAHTADIQIHAWGPNTEETFRQAALALVGVMTDTAGFEDSELHEYHIEVSSPKLDHLLYQYLDEILFRFSTPPYFAPVHIDLNISSSASDNAQEQHLVLRSTILGLIFDPSIHPCGTEVKAVTKSNLSVSPHDAYVILDI